MAHDKAALVLTYPIEDAERIEQFIAAWCRLTGSVEIAATGTYNRKSGEPVFYIP